MLSHVRPEYSFNNINNMACYNSGHHAYIMANNVEIPKIRSKLRYAAPTWLDEVPPNGACVEPPGGGDNDDGGAGWVVRNVGVDDVEVVVGVDDVPPGGAGRELTGGGGDEGNSGVGWVVGNVGVDGVELVVVVVQVWSIH